MRIGNGYDAHRFSEGRKLILGGVEIPYSKGLLGHSDADVLLHAVCDALLGAAAMGDIGTHFPDSSPEYKGISSVILLKETVGIVCAGGYRISNIDSTVIAQEPKLMSYIDRMRATIADACGIDPGRVSVKATTEEKLGYTGRIEGIKAIASVLLEE